MVLIVAFAGPLISPFVDQWIRNKVDDWMKVPDLFDSISIGPEEYAQLPPYWRQALAEIALRPKEDAIDAQNIIKGLKLKDIRLVDLLAPYAISGGILRDNDQLSEHPMPELSYADLSHLQILGILEDINGGRRFYLKEILDPDSDISLSGTTIRLHFKPKKQRDYIVDTSKYSWYYFFNDRRYTMKPTTIQEFMKQFPDDEACLEFLMHKQHGETMDCPKCRKHGKFHKVKRDTAYGCAWCGHQIHPMVGTIFENSHTPLQKWFYAIYLFTTTRHGVPRVGTPAPAWSCLPNCFENGS